MEAMEPSTSASAANPRFIAVAITPVPSRLVNTRASPARAGVHLDARRMDGASDRVSELDLVVRYAVAAQDGALRFAHLGRATLEDLFEVAGFTPRRPRQNRQGGDRPAAHRVNVAERVGGGNGSVGERVVHDGCEEIHGLHEGELRRQLVDAGIVGGLKPDQHVLVDGGARRRGDGGQHPVQNLWTELGRSTGGLDVCG
jgi:hypothetical protein